METSSVFDKIINQAYGVLIGTKGDGVDMRNFSRLMFLILSLYLGYAFAQHGHGHSRDSVIELNQVRELYQGQEFVDEALRFELNIHMNEVDNLFIDFDGKSELKELTIEQKNLIWLRLAKELPVNTNFSLGVDKIRDTGIGFFAMIIEGVDPSFRMNESKLISTFFYDPTKNVYKPTLDPSYVDFEKWDKYSGFVAAREYLAKKPVMEVTFLLQRLPNGNTNADLDQYATLMKNIGLPAKPAEKFVVLEDGNRALAILIDNELLQALYTEPLVLNIVPRID